MGAFQQFVGGMAFILCSALIYSAVTKGIQLGSLADWVSGTATAIGVWVALLTAEKASKEARSVSQESRRSAQEDKARMLFRDHYVAYASALNAVKVAVHRISSTKEAMAASSGGIQKLTALLLIRMVEADKALIQSVNLLLLDPRTANQVTSIAGTLACAVDALNVVVEANPIKPSEIARENLHCRHNIDALVSAAKTIQQEALNSANEGIAAVAEGFRVPPPVFSESK